MKQNRIIHLNALRRILFIVCVVFAGTLSLFAQQNVTVTGVVTDDSGETLPGVTILVQGTTRGVTTDLDGSYTISAKPEDVLLISFIGFQNVTVKIGTQRKIDVQLKPVANELDEVTVVAFGKQRKQSVIASITTVNPSDLKVPSSNLTTALAGRVAGLISYQRTGEPGADNAEFFIRGITTFGTGKKDPLILIDGVEMTSDDLARLNVDDVQSFSIMKDANATALYGSRGANGVILVTSKEGQEGKLKVSFRAEGSYSAPTRTMDYADPVTYMQLHNEAIETRARMLDQIASPLYSAEKILKTQQGKDPLHYPAIDWQNMLFNDHTFNQRYNINISGGGKIARFYVAGSYDRDNGIIKMDKRNNFNNNIQINRYTLRSNVNMTLTKTTEAIVRLYGAFDDYSGPLDDGATLYNKALLANPVLFQPYYELDYTYRGVKHIPFGNYDTGQYLNPYADMVKGYKTKNRTDMLAQFEVKQNLDFITKGLSARALFNVNRYSLLTLSQSYVPFFYSLLNSEDPDDYKLYAINPDSGRETLDLLSSAKELTSTMYLEGVVQYGRKFADKHDVSALMVYTIRESLDGSPKDLQASLPNRNLGLAGRLTYGYDSRYFIEGNFGYNGSERFEKKERFGFFPSIGGGWLVSNESFMQPFSRVISKLKLKATYGLVGNDAIGAAADRFYYMANVNLSNSGRGFAFGYDRENTANGISISRYADPFITWEISKKTNLGLELNLFNSLELQVDWFNEKRTKILQERSYIPSLMGLQATPKSNVGKAHGDGVDISLDYSKSFSKDFWATVRGNFTYAVGKYDYFEEPDYVDTPWLLHTNQKIAQTWGYVAERLFLNEDEVANSPTQFGSYGAGDIKYKDINNDGLINGNDMVPIGYPTTPEINYGFGLSLGYKNFDLSCFFQGSARSAIFVSPSKVSPFVSGRAMLRYWADSHWSETDKDIYATWPRLSPIAVQNNEVASTYWMRDGSFLRMKSAEIGYRLPKNILKVLRMPSARIYLNGSNLFVLSAFKMWDPEMADNGVRYPLQRVVNVGINLEF